MAESLRGKLLIAAPSLFDYFRRTVILVIEHSEEGAIGVVGIQGEALDREPVEVGRVGPVLQDVVELEEAPAGVVEHTIEHYPDAPLMGCVQQDF